MVGKNGWRRQALAATLSGAVLAASTGSSRAGELMGPGAAAPSSPTLSSEQVTSVIKQPVHDLNLLQPDIAPVLRKAASAPYAPSGDCQSIKTEVEELDAVLGPDLDAPEVKKSFKAKAVDTAFDGARDAASSFIPYRGAVRFVSGAEKHDRAVQKATLAGDVRRAYLKGVAEERSCRAQSQDPLQKD